MRHGYVVNKKSALVVGYFGHGNMGDDMALTIAIKIMYDMGITPYVSFSSEGNWEIFEGYGAIRVDSKSGEAMLAAINTCDGVFFLGGNHSRLTVTRKGSEGRKKLLLIKDSYANAMIPMLARHFDLDVIDPRYYNGSIEKYVVENNIQNLLFLFGLDTLALADLVIR